ncbi:hypothetical protein Bca101_027731 [Brassica carinata]
MRHAALDLDSQTDEDGPGSKLRCWFRRKAGEQDLKSPQEKERAYRDYCSSAVYSSTVFKSETVALLILVGFGGIHISPLSVSFNALMVRESFNAVVQVLNGVSGSSSGASIIFNQLVHIHLLYFLGHHPAIFVDSDHFIHKYFLPQDYAILVPVFAGVTLLSLLSVFIGMVMLKSKKKKA